VVAYSEADYSAAYPLAQIVTLNLRMTRTDPMSTDPLRTIVDSFSITFSSDACSTGTLTANATDSSLLCFQSPFSTLRPSLVEKFTDLYLAPEPPTSVLLQAGDEMRLYIGESTNDLKLPMEMTVNLGKVGFVQFNERENTLEVAQGATSNEDVGIYKVTVELSNESVDSNKTYNISIAITPRPELDETVPASLEDEETKRGGKSSSEDEVPPPVNEDF